MNKVLGVIVILLVMAGIGSCMGPTQYEQDSESLKYKIESGDTDNLTDGEQQVYDDFQEWDAENPD